MGASNDSTPNTDVLAGFAHHLLVDSVAYAFVDLTLDELDAQIRDSVSLGGKEVAMFEFIVNGANWVLAFVPADIVSFERGNNYVKWSMRSGFVQDFYFSEEAAAWIDFHEMCAIDLTEAIRMYHELSVH